MRSRLLLLGLAAASACTSPDTRPRGRTVPDPPPRWSAEHQSGVVAGGAWWESFGDAELDSLVQRALAANYDLEEAAAAVRAAVAGAQVARAVKGPNIDATLGASRRRQNFIGFPIPGAEDEVLSTTVTSWDLGLQGSWEIDLWDRLGSAQRAAELDLEAARLDYAAARHSIAAQVARSWFVLVEAELQRDLAMRTVASYEENERIVRDRYEAGLVAALDLRSASSNLLVSRALLSERQRGLVAAQRSLDVLLGRYPEGQLEAARALAELPAPVPAGLPAELLGRRPDLRAAEARVLAGEERVEEARAALYPSFSITGDAGTLTEELEDLLNGDFRVWSLAARLIQPLYDGGRRGAEAEAEAAQRDRLRARFAGSFLRACSEVEVALAAEGFLARRVEHLAAALEDARVAEELSQDQYREGLVALVTVLDAQRRAFDAESAYLAARRTLLENRVDLHVALGGGFEVLEPQSDPEAEG